MAGPQCHNSVIVLEDSEQNTKTGFCISYSNLPSDRKTLDVQIDFNENMDR